MKVTSILNILVLGIWTFCVWWCVFFIGSLFISCVLVFIPYFTHEAQPRNIVSYILITTTLIYAAMYHCSVKRVRVCVCMCVYTALIYKITT